MQDRDIGQGVHRLAEGPKSRPIQTEATLSQSEKPFCPFVFGQTVLGPNDLDPQAVKAKSATISQHKF